MYKKGMRVTHLSSKSRSELLALFLWVAAFSLGACAPDDCPDIKAQAKALVAEAQACSPENECVKFSYYENVGSDRCLEAFLCDTALGAHVDLEAFSAEARSLVESFRDCGECVVAGCGVDEQEPHCNLETALCELRPAPP